MNKIKIAVGSLFGLLSLVPALAFAQNTGGNLPLTNLNVFLVGVRSLMGLVVPILIGLAVIVFLWGVLQFVFHADDSDKRSEGKSFMIWGIIGIAVMVSVWGLVGFLQGTFNIQPGAGQAQPGPALPVGSV